MVNIADAKYSLNITGLYLVTEKGNELVLHALDVSSMDISNITESIYIYEEMSFPVKEIGSLKIEIKPDASPSLLDAIGNPIDISLKDFIEGEELTQLVITYADDSSATYLIPDNLSKDITLDDMDWCIIRIH